MNIALQDFVEDVVGSGLRGEHWRNNFQPDVLRRWLADNAWVEDPTSLCVGCQRKRSFFSEEKCQENVQGGGSCYRETLRTVFVPFVREALNGQAPRLRELGNVVHRAGAIWDGAGESKLYDLIDHELGGTYATICVEYSRAHEKD